MPRYGIVLGAALLLGLAPAMGAASMPFDGQTGTGSNPHCPGEQARTELLAKASALIEKRDFKTAIALLEGGVVLRCQVQANMLLAGAFEALGDGPAELATLQRAQKRWPADASVAASLARYYMSSGDPQAAAATLEHCRFTPHTPLRELQLIASVYLENHDLQQSTDAAKAAYIGYPSEETLLFAANLLQLEGRYMDVIALMSEVKAQYGSSSRFLITLAESEYDAQMYKAALQDVSQGLTLDGASYAGHYVMANTLAKTGDLNNAVREYQGAIELSPSQPRTYYRLALVQEMQQDLPAAQASLAQAIAADNRYAPAYGELGKLSLRQNQYQQAVEQLTKAIQYNPRFEEAYFLLVQAYARLGEREKSETVLSQWNQLKAQRKARPVDRKADSPLTEYPTANR